ncbi:hypothetical protein BH23THE1_BH23THE1_31370 [soil metagenome]
MFDCQIDGIFKGLEDGLWMYNLMSATNKFLKPLP